MTRAGIAASRLESPWRASRHQPGEIDGIGPVDPALVRELAAAAARDPASTWCLTITGHDGRPVAHGCGRPPPPTQRGKAPPDDAARDGPACIPAGEQDTPGTDGGPPGGYGTDGGPPGGYGTIRLDLAALTGTGTAGGGGRELAFALDNLAGPCDHKHQAAGHDPGRMLRHLTGVLNAACTHPSCRRPEGSCDYEHSQPYGKGGKTCLCDAGPVCRHDHQAKQSPGWRLEHAGARGWFRWITPSGRSYLSRPTQYPH